MNSLSVIFVSFNDSSRINTIIRKLLNEFSSSATTVEFIVYDNSPDVPFCADSDLSQVVSIPFCGNVGFACGASEAAKRASGRWLLFLNSDVDFEDGQFRFFLNEVFTCKQQRVYGPLLTGVSEHAPLIASPSSGGSFHFRISRLFQKISGRGFSYKHLRYSPLATEKGKEKTQGEDLFSRVDWVAGTAMVIEKSVFEMAGGFSSSYFLYFEDVDLCYRLKTMGIDSCLFRGSLLRHKGEQRICRER